MTFETIKCKMCGGIMKWDMRDGITGIISSYTCSNLKCKKRLHITYKRGAKDWWTDQYGKFIGYDVPSPEEAKKQLEILRRRPVRR